MLRKRDLALRYFDDYRRFDGKLPQTGGLWDQPSSWRYLLNLALDAEAQVERERRMQEAEEND